MAEAAPQEAEPAPEPAPEPEPSPEPTPEPDPEPAPEPEPEPQEADWRAAIKNEEARKFAEDSTDIDHLATRALDMRKKLAGAIIKPGEDASEEEIAEFNKALGVPEKPEEYEFEVPEGYELTDEDKAFQEKSAELFHNLGISKEAAKGLSSYWNELQSAAEQAQVEADERYAEQSEAQLKQEWGPDYDTNKEFANRGAEYLFGNEIGKVREIQMKDGRFLLDHPDLIKPLAKIGRETSDSGLGPSVMTEETLQTKKDELSDLKNKQHEAYFSGRRDEADRLQPKIDKLAEEIGGTGPLVGADNRTL